MRIDAHQHYWSIERNDYGWITPELPILYRDYLPQHLHPHLNRHHMDGTILVQAAPTIEETEYLLQLADSSDQILGVVGWLDLNDPEHRGTIEQYQKHPKFVGFRIMIQEMTDASAVLEPHFVKALRSFVEEEIPIDILVLSRQLEPLAKLLDQVPGLRAVIDHIGKPMIKGGLLEPWLSDMTSIAQHSNIYCKLSGMVTEADHGDWRSEHFTSYIQHVLTLFGPDRVLFGSDWPVCLLAATYDQVVDIVEQALPASWGERERNRLFGLNAKKFYKLQNLGME